VFVNNNNESYNNLKDDLREGEGFEGKEVQSEGWERTEYNNDGEQISESSRGISQIEGDSVYGRFYTKGRGGQAVYFDDSRRNTLNDIKKLF